MMKKSAILRVVFLLVALSGPAWAGMEKMVSVEGVVGDFDSDKVTLMVDGRKVVVPRAAIPSHYSVRSGNLVVAYMSSQSLQEDLSKSRKKSSR